MSSFFFLFFFARPSDPPWREGSEGGRWPGNEKHFMGMALHLYSLVTDTANIFSSRFHAVFFREDIALSYRYHSILIRKSEERYILDTKAQGHQSCSLRKHPFLQCASPPRETSPAAKSEEKRMFSQAINPGKYHREAWADWEPKLSRQIRAKCIVVQFTKWRTKFSNQRRSAGRQKKQDPILMISLNQSSRLQRNRVRLRN